MPTETNLWEQEKFNDLPPGIRGLTFSLAQYTNEPKKVISKLQQWLSVPQTGKVDHDTCTAAKNMLQYKGSIDTLNELGTFLGEGQVNGIRYRISQYGFRTVGYEDPRQFPAFRLDFSKENYGQKVEE